MKRKLFTIGDSIIVVGIIIFFASLWGGAYLCNINKDGWAEFPSFCTSFLGCCLGLITTIVGFACLGPDKS